MCWTISWIWQPQGEDKTPADVQIKQTRNNILIDKL